MKVFSSNSPPTLPTQVLCVDDSEDTTFMMRMLIDGEPLMQCVGCLNSADDLIQEAGDLTPPPDVVILDATMPGKNPLDVMKKMSMKFPAIRTIVYSGYDDQEFVARVRDAGAWGCISKREEPEAIIRAVREVAAGNAWFPRPGR